MIVPLLRAKADCATPDRFSQLIGVNRFHVVAAIKDLASVDVQPRFAVVRVHQLVLLYPLFVGFTSSLQLDFCDKLRFTAEEHLNPLVRVVILRAPAVRTVVTFVVQSDSIDIMIGRPASACCYIAA